MNGNNNFYNPYLMGNYSNGLGNQNNYNLQSQNYTNSVITVFVTSELAAQCYPVGAGNTVLLVDFDHKMFWIKSTDSNGVPMQMRAFDFSERIEQPAESPASNTENVVSRDEFNELKNMFSELKTTLEDVLK